MKIFSPHIWPAEWEPQAATWIAWPHNLETWPLNFDRIPTAFVHFVRAISQFQPVHVLSGPAGIEPRAEELLREIPNVQTHAVVTNDTWIRDYGPTFVRNKSTGALIGVDWRYNAWGGKYPPFDDDARVAEQICRIVGCPRSLSAMFCEGGSLDSDGQGTLLTTSSCLLSSSRNPGWKRDMVEAELMRQLGVETIVWVDGGGLLGDDTDGHIDQLARFVAPGVVVAATSSVHDDPNRVGLESNLRILAEVQLREGPLTVHALPTPPPRFANGNRVPESYCNFLFVNTAVLVPTFGNDHTDQAAIDLLASLLPERQIVPVDSSDIIFGLGALHCASQQQPA